MGDAVDGAGAAPPRAIERRERPRRACAAFGAAHGRAVVGAGQRARQRAQPLDHEPGAGAGVRAARVRRLEMPFRADRLHAGQCAASTRPSSGAACGAPAGCAAAASASIDWFCGLGNFTLPLATRAREVLGIEGSQTLVERARANARRNGLHADFAVRDLFELTPEALAADGHAHKWLVDPPREGAFALAKAAADLVQGGGMWQPPTRIVYVSCNPATLARDAGLLVHQAGYRCSVAAWSTCFRTPRTWNRSRCSTDHEKGGPRAPCRSDAPCGVYSSLPPPIPNRASRPGRCCRCSSTRRAWP